MKDIIRYESLEDALMFAIRASNIEIKVIANALWPAEKIETATARLRDALNSKRKQKLLFSEVIFIMHLCGRYDPLYYMADECLHDRPAKKSIHQEQEDMKDMLDDMYAKVMKSYQQFNALAEKREVIEKIQKGNVTFLDIERKTG